MNSFNKILIANRGEIAVRVIKTARKLGYETVAVYSEADANALHVKEADEAICIGAAPVGESYLKTENIIDAIERSGAGAVHPGYGFLSENADFARALKDAGVAFIGPSPEAIDLMGNKRAAKIEMLKAKVPCVPGYEGGDQSDKVLIEEAKKIGFPIMVKATAGGGGRGMRLVNEGDDFAQAIESARSEAEKAFGNGEMILEKAVIQPRHVEIQVIADQQGNTLYIGERDCSIQRRHQKVIEEAPSPAVSETLRKQMGEAAVDAAKACHYVGAGTVEFLLDQDGEFYFLEMNTRLQVEHPVTEMISGLDLVEWQINIAQGEDLPLTQDQIKLSGHAIEARLYAEDPAKEFLPQTGDVLHWQIPANVDVRMDHGIAQGQEISPHYDPMIAKIIVHGENRDQARRKLFAAINQTEILGVNTNKQFLANICNHPVFADGEATTAFIGEHFYDDSSLSFTEPATPEIALAATLLGQLNTANLEESGAWRIGGNLPVKIRLALGEDVYTADLTSSVENRGARDIAVVKLGDNESTDMGSATCQALELDGEHFTFILNGIRKKIAYATSGNTLYLDIDNGNRTFVDKTNEPPVVGGGAGSGRITAPMEGVIVKVHVAEGDKVTAGQLLVVMEAMKMEHQLKSDIDGVITAITTSEGDQVKVRQLLVEVSEE